MAGVTRTAIRGRRGKQLPLSGVMAGLMTW